MYIFDVPTMAYSQILHPKYCIHKAYVRIAGDMHYLGNGSDAVAGITTGLSAKFVANGR